MCDSEAKYWEQRTRDQKIADAVMAEAKRQGVAGEYAGCARDLGPPLGLVKVERSSRGHRAGEYAVFPLAGLKL